MPKGSALSPSARRTLDELQVPEVYHAPRGRGRPSIYSQELANEIFDRMGIGESLREICRTEGMPNRATILRWRNENEDFSAQYARAREAQIEALADDIIDISDSGANDWMARNDPDNPGWLANGEHLARSRLRFDARRWLASKIMPKVYGDKITQEHVGPGGGPLKVEDARTPTALLLTGMAKEIEGPVIDGVAEEE